MATGEPVKATEGRRERRARELRRRIYTTAQRLFLEHGFDQTTVGQIAEAADIAPATFFNHFQSKSAVLDAMTSEVLEYLRGMLDEELERDATTQQKISAFADRIGKEILAVHEQAHDALLGLIHTGTHVGEVAPHTRKIRDPFASMLREGQQKNEVREDLDAVFMAELVLGSLNAAISNWLGDPEFPLADRLRETAHFMGEAIRPRPAP